MARSLIDIAKDIDAVGETVEAGFKQLGHALGELTGIAQPDNPQLRLYALDDGRQLDLKQLADEIRDHASRGE